MIQRIALEKLAKAYPQVAQLLREYDRQAEKLKQAEDEIARLQGDNDHLKNVVEMLREEEHL